MVSTTMSRHRGGARCEPDSTSEANVITIFERSAGPLASVIMHMGNERLEIYLNALLACNMSFQLSFSRGGKMAIGVKTFQSD
jgi:hypothetical protein